MLDFKIDIPTKLFFGQDAIKNLPSIMENFDKNVLLVYGGGSIKKNGIYQKVLTHLEEYNIFELSDIDPNPRIESVRQGVEMCHRHNISVILAVGGGSTIDCSKVIAAGFYYDGDPWDLVMDSSKIDKALPIVDILTLAATGTEMNTSAVISNLEIMEKKGTSAYSLYPYASILDPTYTYTVSPYQTAAGTADIMSHVFENYFQKYDNANITDGLSETILRACVKYLPMALEEPTNYEARSNLMYAATMALNGFTSKGKSGGWTCHGIEHYLSAYYDLTHGVGLAIITPRWMEYILNEETVKRFANYAHKVWEIPVQKDLFSMAREGIRQTYEFFKESGIPMTLEEVHINDQYFKIIGDKIEEKLKKAYVPLNSNDVEQILLNCLRPMPFN